MDFMLQTPRIFLGILQYNFERSSEPILAFMLEVGFPQAMELMFQTRITSLEVAALLCNVNASGFLLSHQNVRKVKTSTTFLLIWPNQIGEKRWMFTKFPHGVAIDQMGQCQTPRGVNWSLFKLYTYVCMLTQHCRVYATFCKKMLWKYFCCGLLGVWLLLCWHRKR